MEIGIGVAFALAVGVFASALGFERDRAFYPTVLIVVASYYGLFAVMAPAWSVLPAEAGAFAIVLLAAVIGFRSNLWLVVAALAAHGLFDLIHGHIITNPGLPAWWPMFCLGYDLTAAAYLAWRLLSARNATPAAPHTQPFVDRAPKYYGLLRAREATTSIASSGAARRLPREMA